jgi:membrane-associated protease RseP (regulator of RpoE activity)
MSNTAPAIPFDGGHIFNESIDVAIEKIERDEKKRKRCADAITYAASLLIFSLIAWQLIGPRI